MSDSSKYVQYYRGERLEQDKLRIESPGYQYILQLINSGVLGNLASMPLKALDVGCGSGFNLVSFHRLGWSAYGCEISEDIVSYAKRNVLRFEAEADIRVGHNEQLPFENNYFDFLLSYNVIHYVGSRQGIEKTISEYARVLKPRGRLVLCTMCPDNWLLVGAKRIGEDNLLLLNRPDDYRNQETLFVFNSPEELHGLFSPFFSNLHIGKNQIDMVDRVLRHFLLTGLRK